MSAHVNDIGFVFQVPVIDFDLAPLDISTATTLQIRLVRPDSTVVVGTGTLTTDGRDGRMQYATVSGDLNQAGVYNAQGVVTLDGSHNYRSQTTTFTVAGNL